MFKVVTVLALASSQTSGFSISPATRTGNGLSSSLNRSLGASKPLISNSILDQQQRNLIQSTSLKATTAPSSSDNTELDTDAIVKYSVALITQLSLITGFFFGLDTLLPTVGLDLLPTPITWIIIYTFSLKSRVFNPLNNARPNRAKAVKEEGSAGFQDRIQPSWTPTGVVFPIMWLLIIGPLRATSSTIIIESVGSYLSLPLMSLMLHLSCGDVWNTINNTEKRYGTSVLGISTVYFSALHAAYQYYEVDPLAGKLLGATAIWLTIASTLIIDTWRLNVDEKGEKQSLLPVKTIGEESVTGFSWGRKKEE